MADFDPPIYIDPTYLGKKKLVFGIDHTGQFTVQGSSGWETENIAKSLAWEHIHEKINLARLAVQAGRKSPLEYWRECRQMDLALLASNVRLPRWRVWLHLRPFFFNRLNEKTLKRYADVLNLTPQQLEVVP